MDTSSFECRKIELSLDAYHDDELDTAEYQMIRDHLCKCAGCANKLDQIRHTVSALKNLPRVSLEKDMAEQLDNLLKKNRQKTKIKRLIIGGAVGIAAAVASWIMANLYPQINTLQVVHLGQGNLQAVNHQIRYAQPVALMQQKKTAGLMANLGRQKSVHLLPLRPVQLHRRSNKVENENLLANDAQVANVFGSDQNCISETLGCATDEDGLYALKM